MTPRRGAGAAALGYDTRFGSGWISGVFSVALGLLALDHAVFLHANVRSRFGLLAEIVGTPRFHHWHHAVHPVDRNFAIHLPVIDRLFGTHHLPRDEWPGDYGIAGHPVPEPYPRQLTYPFARRG